MKKAPARPDCVPGIAGAGLKSNDRLVNTAEIEGFSYAENSRLLFVQEGFGGLRQGVGLSFLLPSIAPFVRTPSL